MNRNNYEEIENKFSLFISTWKSRRLDILDDIIDPETECYLSVVQKYASGAQHSLFGVKDFVRTIPSNDTFHIAIANFVCRGNESMAQQTASVVCRAVKTGDSEIQVFDFVASFANHWKLTQTGWKMVELRMDIWNQGGDIEEFLEAWYFDETPARWYDGVHVSCIHGEFDSPWIKYPSGNDFFTEEEMIEECFAQYVFGIDTISYNHCDASISSDAMFRIDPWGVMDKRFAMESSKSNRQVDRLSTHPFMFKKIHANGNHAHAGIYRLSGQGKNRDYPYTPENINMGHACGRWEVTFRKENGSWKILRLTYFEGTIEIGESVFSRRWSDVTQTL